MPFIPELARLFGARFVVLVRDGRDVAASLVDWHNQMYPIVYQECREPAELGPHAQNVLAAQHGPSEFDHSLPRPAKDDPWHRDWPEFSRFEMAAWYWNAINLRLLRWLRALPADRFMLVDYTRPSAAAIRRVYDFVGLPDFDEAAVAALLARPVNSLRDRIGAPPAFPRWPDWDATRRQRFDDLAHPAMAALGYAEPVRGLQPGFRRGRSDAVPAEAIAAAEAWLGRAPELTGRVLRLAEPAADAGSGDCADTVVALAGLDRAVDVDEAARRVAGFSARFLYLRAGGTHRDDMAEHRYRHAAGTSGADISAVRLAATLRKAGFAEVAAYPSRTGDGGRETILVAARDRLPDALRPAADDVAFAFGPYQVVDSGLDRSALERQVNAACAYLSVPPFGLADDLNRADDWFAALQSLRGRRFGTVAALARGQDAVNSAVRIDIDADLVAALGLARAARQRDLPVSFYILHTAGYYGRLEDGGFLRHGAAASIYREMQELGCELGLHTDPYKLYLDDGIDGAAAIAAELGWLRGEGLRIEGSSAHNCVQVYGVENFEVFHGHEIRPGGWVGRRGRVAPLGVLDPVALGLTYEAGAARRGRVRRPPIPMPARS